MITQAGAHGQPQNRMPLVINRRLSWVRIFVCGAELAAQSQRRRTMVHACWKSWVFSRRLKVLSDSSGARSEGGRLFQVAGPNTAKLRWPVEVRTLGKRRVPVVAERNWRLPSTEVTGMHRSARLRGALSCRHFHRTTISTRTAVLKVMRWRIGSQWSSARTGEMWSHLPLVTTIDQFAWFIYWLCN